MSANSQHRTLAQQQDIIPCTGGAGFGDEIPLERLAGPVRRPACRKPGDQLPQSADFALPDTARLFGLRNPEKRTAFGDNPVV